MNGETARGLLERALDGTLSAEASAAFERALLADAELRAEYAELKAFREQTRALAQQEPLEPRVDLLSGVQQKLRSRSGGKFYRDRFAETRGVGNLPWLLGLSSLLLVAVCVWFLFQGW